MTVLEIIGAIVTPVVVLTPLVAVMLKLNAQRRKAEMEAAKARAELDKKATKALEKTAQQSADESGGFPVSVRPPAKASDWHEDTPQTVEKCELLRSQLRVEARDEAREVGSRLERQVKELGDSLGGKLDKVIDTQSKLGEDVAVLKKLEERRAG